MRLIIDTGVLYASMDRRDAHHLVCRDLLSTTSDLFIIPAPVLPELDHFVRTRLGVAAQLSLLRDIVEGRLTIIELQTAEYSRVYELCRKYADSDISFVDASVVTIAERLNEPAVATLDHRHFSVIRPRHVDRLQLLPRLTRSRTRRKLDS